MHDPLIAAIDAVAHHARFAPVLVFAAGAASSFGPCAAPRFLAVASYAGTSHARGTVLGLTFGLGLAVGYASLGTALGAVGAVVDRASSTYALLSAFTIVSGIATLARAGAHDETCTPHMAAPGCSLGAVFLFGAASAFTFAPCCTPAVGAIVAYTSAYGDPLACATLLAIFALGHAVPVVIVAAGVGRCAELMRRVAMHQATAIVSATLSIVLGAFYGCLA
jgi:cytochrome c biogenesis protein CcdA